MNTKKSKAVSCFLALAAVIVLTVLDQLTKNLAVKYLMNKEPIVLWDGVFELKYLENRGRTFGLCLCQSAYDQALSLSEDSYYHMCGWRYWKFYRPYASWLCCRLFLL